MVTKSIRNIELEAKELIGQIEQMEVDNITAASMLKKYTENIGRYKAICMECSERMDVTSNAIAILTDISDNVVQDSYKFMEDNINVTLERMFANTTRKIKLVESLRNSQYPQLDIELTVENGVKRKLKDSGHGLMQTISFIVKVCLTAVSDCRKIIIADEVLSGLSAKSRKNIEDVMWAFAEAGFQFIVCEHGFVPKGAQTIVFQLKDGITSIKDVYIEENGVYLNGIDYITNNEDDLIIGEGIEI